MADATKKHPWPDQISLPECPVRSTKTLQIYEKYQYNRPHRAWFDGDLLDLAQLSKITCDVEDQLEMLEKEGHIVFGGKSGMVPIENPRLRVISTLNGIKSTAANRLKLAARWRDEDNAAETSRQAQAETQARSAAQEVRDEAKKRKSLI